MNYILYGNGSSGNHGCEAIIRGTHAVLGGNMRILSQSPNEDAEYGIREFAEVLSAVNGRPGKVEWLKAYAKLKLTGNFTDMDGVSYLPAILSSKGYAKLAFSAGGDNYCYANPEFYSYLNEAYRRIGCRTILWGCSVEPEVVEKSQVSEDLKKYSLIVARESISYAALRMVNKNTVLAPDPAFFMEMKECILPEAFNSAKVIGINASPMILSNELKEGIAFQNYLNLIRYILKETDYHVALIPHVVWSRNDDRTVLQKLSDEINCPERVTVIEDHSAPELKYIISNCDVFIGARTHATIAAYSTGVPTIVIGYSVKARGIAKDLFGKTDGYVLSVQELEESTQLLSAVTELLDAREDIRMHLTMELPKYKAMMKEAITAIYKMDKSL